MVVISAPAADAPGARDLLPEAAELPGEWIVENEGERTDTDVALQFGEDGRDLLFSLGWVFTLGLLAVAALALLTWQHLTPGAPLAVRAAPLPGWSKPLLAVLCSAWLGIGAGLLTRPGFWHFLPPSGTPRNHAP